MKRLNDEHTTKTVTDRLMKEAMAQAFREMLSEQPLLPWRLYSAREVAGLTGMSDKAVYAIPEAVLPRTRTGEAQSGVRYLGLHVMCYLLGSEPPDAELLMDEAQRSIRGRGRVLAMRSGGKTRVL